jgi:hypothetical protein
MSRILELAHIANVFEPPTEDAHYIRFHSHDEKSGQKPRGEGDVGRLFISTEAICTARRVHVRNGPAARSEEPKLSISGYDPVAYFPGGKPKQGKTEFEYLWHKLRRRFASGQHRDLFVKDPDRYAPQYDGYCAMGVATTAVG